MKPNLTCNISTSSILGDIIISNRHYIYSNHICLTILYLGGLKLCAVLLVKIIKELKFFNQGWILNFLCLVALIHE